MADRQTLIRQVKAEYARLADLESREGFTNATSADIQTPEAYYEALLDQVLHQITAGRFDHCADGREVVEAVANDRERYGIRM